jgi:hypothetical protein
MRSCYRSHFSGKLALVGDRVHNLGYGKSVLRTNAHKRMNEARLSRGIRWTITSCTGSPKTGMSLQKCLQLKGPGVLLPSDSLGGPARGGLGTASERESTSSWEMSGPGVRTQGPCCQWKLGKWILSVEENVESKIQLHQSALANNTRALKSVDSSPTCPWTGICMSVVNNPNKCIHHISTWVWFRNSKYFRYVLYDKEVIMDTVFSFKIPIDAGLRV